MTTGWQNRQPLQETKNFKMHKRGREKSYKPLKAGVKLFASSERTLDPLFIIRHLLEAPIVFQDESGSPNKQYMSRGQEGRLCLLEDAGRFPGRILRMNWGWLVAFPLNVCNASIHSLPNQ